MARTDITDKDFEKYGIINPPTAETLAELPEEVYDQLVKTLTETIETSATLERSEELRQAKLDEIYRILGSGQVAKYGSKVERTGLEPDDAPPIQTSPVGAPPLKATTAVKRQQDVTGRKGQTLVNVIKTIEQKLPQQLTELQTPDGKPLFTPQEIPEQVQAFRALYEQLRIENLAFEGVGAPRKNDVELYAEALEQYANILTGKIPTLSEEEIDPEMQGLTSTPYINAYSRQVIPGAIPDYTRAQLAYFQKLNRDKVDLYVDRKFEEKMRTAPRMYYYEVDGIKRAISQPVLEHIISSPTAAIIYSPEIDDSIREQYNATMFGLSPVRINSPDYVVQPHEARAMAKVEAITNLGGGQWFQDPDQKKRVLENLDKFKEVGNMEVRTPLGGTAETPFGHHVRVAFSPFNAFATATQRAAEQEVAKFMGAGAEALEAVGVLPELPEGESYYDPEMATRIRMKERRKDAPLYTGRMALDIPFTDEVVEFEPDSLLGEMVDSVARNRGHLDFNTALADGLNIDGATKLGMQAFGLTADFLSPDMAVLAGAIKGAKAGVKMYQAQKAVYNADSFTSAAEAFRALERAATKEILDDANFIGLTQKVVAPKVAKKLDNVLLGDVRLYMSDDMARNLEAREVLKGRVDAVDEAAMSGVEDTLYYKAFLEAGSDVKRADDLFFAQMKQNKQIPKMLEQFDEMAFILDEAAELGSLEKAIKRHRTTKKKVDYKYLEDIYNRAGKQPDVRTVFEQINNAKRILTTVMGRGMFFTVSPKIGDLENIVSISRNTFGTPKARTDVVAMASRTELAKSIRKVRSMPASQQIKPAEFSSYKLYGDDLVAKQGKVELSYNLDGLSPSDKMGLRVAVQELDAPVTYRNYLMQQIDNNRIFESDLNELVMKNRDDVAIGRRDVFTTEEINKLPPTQQKKLLEPAGSSARQDFRNGFFAQAIDKIMEVKDSLSSVFKMKKIQKETQTPLTTQVDTFQKTRMLEEVQKEVGQLDQKLSRDFRELVKGGQEKRAKYVTDPENPMSKSEALGALIVGQRQVGSGVDVQQQEMANTLMWMLNRCFYDKQTKMAASAADEITGVTTVLNSNIWASAARPLIEEEIQQLAKRSVANPRRMWEYFQQYVNELDELLQTDPYILGIDPATEQVIRVRLVDPDQGYQTLKTVSNVELENLMEEITVGGYFHAEGNRINHRYLTDVVDKELTQLNVQNILPDVKIDQELFEQVIRDTLPFVWRNTDVYKVLLKNVEGVVKDAQFQQVLKKLNNMVDIDTLDVHKSIEADFNRIVKEEMQPMRDSVQATKKQLDDELPEQLAAIKQKHDDIYDRANQRLKDDRELKEKRAIGNVRQRANKLIEKAGRRSAEASVLRKQRDKKIRELERKYVREAEQTRKQLRARRTQNRTTEQRQLEADNARLKEDLDTQLRENELSMKENFQINMAGKDVSEALEWYTKNYPQADPDFSTLQTLIRGEVFSAEDIDKVARQSIDYSEVIMRNKELDIASAPTLTEVDDVMSKMFGPNNEKFGRLLLGDSYDDIKNLYVSQGITGAQQNLKKIIQNEPESFDFLMKFMDIMTPIFYFNILGIRSRFFGMNFITAPYLTYQTLGRFSNPLSGLNVVRKGGRIGARGADDVAVRGPDGLTFTNREVFELIERSGVKSEYNFIKSMFNDGSLMRYLKAYEKPGVGYGKWFIDNMYSGIEFMNQIGTHTDMMWRSSIFIDAIKNGSSVEEATGMARVSLFDYNNLWDWERKNVMKVTVFWNFQRQNIAAFSRALLNPTMLNRYVRIYKSKRDMNAIFADINDGKRYPYEMYMPEYTQTRMIYGQQQGIGNNRQLLMSPSVPALEAVMFYTDILAKDPLTVLQERSRKLLSPTVAMVIGTKEEKYKSKKISPEYVNLIAAYNDDPQAIADAFSLMPGLGTIEPKFVGHNAVGNVNGYIYPLNEAQQKQYGAFEDAIGFIGATVGIFDYSRAAFPEGTPYEGLSPYQRMLALTGVLTPARQKSIIDQQVLNLQRINSELRKKENLEVDLRKGAMLSGVKPKDNPSEEQ